MKTRIPRKIVHSLNSIDTSLNKKSPLDNILNIINVFTAIAALVLSIIVYQQSKDLRQFNTLISNINRTQSEISRTNTIAMKQLDYFDTLTNNLVGLLGETREHNKPYFIPHLDLFTNENDSFKMLHFNYKNIGRTEAKNIHITISIIKNNTFVESIKHQKNEIIYDEYDEFEKVIPISKYETCDVEFRVKINYSFGKKQIQQVQEYIFKGRNDTYWFEHKDSPYYHPG